MGPSMPSCILYSCSFQRNSMWLVKFVYNRFRTCGIFYLRPIGAHDCCFGCFRLSIFFFPPELFPIRCQCSFVHADFGKHTYREARFYAKKGNHESHRGNTIFWRRLQVKGIHIFFTCIYPSLGSPFIIKICKLICLPRFKDFKTSMSISEMLKANLLLRVLGSLLYNLQ